MPLMLLISAGCILCDVKDAEKDRKRHVPSLPVLLGIRPACFAATGLAFLAAMLALAHHHFGITLGALLLTLAAQFPALLSMKSVGPIVIDSILLIPGVLSLIGVL